MWFAPPGSCCQRGPQPRGYTTPPSSGFSPTRSMCSPARLYPPDTRAGRCVVPVTTEPVANDQDRAIDTDPNISRRTLGYCRQPLPTHW